MRKFVVFAFFLLALGIFIYFRFQSQGSSTATCKDCNVILITMTNLRYDHMSQNGYVRPTTPNLDKLAKESLVFDNAFAHSSWTLSGGISLYTSLYPYQHGIMNRYDGSKLSENTPTLIDLLNKDGYKTAAFTGSFDYNPIFGLSNRFAEYQECKKNGQLDCTMPKALSWIKNNLATKFFVHIQGFDAHCPFSQKGGAMYDKDYKGVINYSTCLWTFDKSEPRIINGKTYYLVGSPATGGKASILLGEEDIAHLVALYDESITAADAHLGSFLDAIKQMGLADNTIIIFTSEHGDMFGKNGRFMRGGPLSGTFYDDVLHVPLIIKHPKLMPARLERLVEHIDIMPTLLDFLSIPKKFFLQGKSLIPLIVKNEPVHQYIFAGSEYHPGENNAYFTKDMRVEAIRSKEWKLIKETVISQDIPSETVELYDMTNDRKELHDLAGTRSDILQDLQSKLNVWSEKMRKGKVQ